MKASRIVLSALFALAAGHAPRAASAHGFYAMANRANFERPGATATFFINYGHLPPVDEFIDAKDVERYEAISPAGKVVPLRAEGRSFQANELKLEEEGFYQLVAVKAPGIFSSIKGSDGTLKSQRAPKAEVKLEPGDSRVSTRSLQRFAKALVASGAVSGGAPSKLGLLFEIVLVSEPGKLRVGQPARFQVLYKGRPLADAKVTAIGMVSAIAGGTPTAAEADAQGTVTLTPAEAGTWMLEVTHTIEAQGDAQKAYDQQVYSTTLAVGVPRD